MTAALREESGSIAQNSLGRFVRTDLDYVRGVSEAGGVPVVLSPSLSLRAAETLLDGLDGLLLSGGPDLDPGYYGEGPMPELGTTRPSARSPTKSRFWAALTWRRSRIVKQSRSTRTIIKGSRVRPTSSRWPLAVLTG